MGVPHTNELPVFRGLFHIDIAVQGGIALEVDGGCSTMYFGCVCVNPSSLYIGIFTREFMVCRNLVWWCIGKN
jgi:hypothetical protein